MSFFYDHRRLLAGVLLSTLLLSGCTPKNDTGSGEQSSEDVSTSQNTDGSGSQDQQPDESSVPASGSASLQEEKSQQEPAAAYDFSKPCPESAAVDNSYFADAAFIGDSRTEGLMLYSGIGQVDKYTSIGISIFKLESKKAVTINGVDYTLVEALAQKQYNKVYICLGVNELGYFNDQGFYDSYCKVIDDIRASQPNAVIYIQNLVPLNEDTIAARGGSPYLTNEHLRVYNELTQKVALEKQVVYLDLYSAFVGADGQLPADASTDGVHLTGSYYKAWLEYLKTHTVSYETLYPEGGAAQ